MNDKTQAMPTGAAGDPAVGGAQVFDPNRTQQADYQRTPTGAFPAQNLAGGVPGGIPGSAGALGLQVKVGTRLAVAGERVREHILTQVTASGQPSVGGQRLPVNVSLVIDRSGSMEGDPLEYVKQACAHVVDLLQPTDVLSIVTFEENVEVLMPARHVTDPNLIKQHVARIVSGNTTNLFDGLYAGGAQAGSVPPEGYVTRVLLLTDGEPTAGLRDFASIVNQVADLKAKGITVTALGFGPEYNEELMAGIARRAGGNYYHIARPEQIPDVFRQELETVLGVTAKNARLALHLPRGCSVRQVYGSPPTFGARTAEISLGDIERGTTTTRLWEVDWEPHRAGTYRVARAVLSYDDGTTGRTTTISSDAVVEFVSDRARVLQGADPVVAQELSIALAGRDLQQTMMGLRTQQLSAVQATQALERTQALLTQQGRTAEASELAEAAQALRRGDEGLSEKTLIGTIYHLDQGKRK